MATFYISNRPVSGQGMQVAGDLMLAELRGCLVDGVECRVESSNGRVTAEQGSFDGFRRFYRIMSAGSQSSIITARHPRTGAELDSFSATFRVRTPAVLPFRIRIPVMETAAMQYGPLVGAPGVPLSSAEIALGHSIFGESIRFQDVRVVVSSFAAAPTTMGNTIRTTDRTMQDHVLIHELAHIWQYQTGGGSYISSAGCAQGIAFLTAGDRNAAYAYEPGRDFSTFNAEQQAHVIEDYFRMPNLRNDRWYADIMERVRRSRPSTSTQSAYEESLYGRQNVNLSPALDFSSSNLINPTQTVPIVRLEF